MNYDSPRTKKMKHSNNHFIKEEYDNYHSNEDTVFIGSSLKVGNQQSARGLLLEYIVKKKYKNLKECVYDLYMNPLYRSVPYDQRRSVLIDYFKRIRSQEENDCKKFIVDNLIPDDSSLDFFAFAREIGKYFNNIDIKHMYDFYVNKSNTSSKRFKKFVNENNITPLTSPTQIIKYDDARNTNGPIIEDFYVYLKQFEEFFNIEHLIVNYMKVLNQLYLSGNIKVFTRFEDVVNILREEEGFAALIGTVYNPHDLFYYFKHKVYDKTNRIQVEEPSGDEKEAGEL